MSLGLWISLLTGLMITYWPAISSLYAYHDSLIYFLDTDVRIAPPGTTFAFITGRYLAAVFQVLIGRSVDSLQDLQVVRFLSVLQLSFCAIVMTNWLRRNFLRTVESLLSVFIIFTLPPFQIVVCQAGMSFYPMSILMAIASFLACVKALDRSIGRRQRIVLYAWSVLLFVIALTIYPSGAMFFWAMMAATVFFCTKEPFQVFCRKSFFLLAAGFSGTVIYRLLLEATKSLYLSFQITQYSPYDVSTKFADKIFWFFSDPVVKILNFWNIIPSLNLVFYFGGFIVVALLLAFAQRTRNISWKESILAAGFKAVLLCGLFFLTSLPNLLYAEHIAFYRCYMALAAFAVFIFLWSLLRYAKIFSAIEKSVVIVVLSFLAVAGIVFARHAITQYRTRISVQEFKFLKQALQSVNLNHYSRVYIVQPDQKDMFVSDDEYGNLTTSYGNDIIGFFSAGIMDLMKKDFKVYHIDHDPTTRKTIYFFKRYNEKDPSSSYKVILDFGFDIKNPGDFKESTLVIDMNRVADFLREQKRGRPIKYSSRF